MDAIKARILELELRIVGALYAVDSYSDLSEKERFPFRVLQAEKIALEEYYSGEDLDYWLNTCIEKEQYAGAEGIKRAKDFLNQLNPTI